MRRRHVRRKRSHEESEEEEEAYSEESFDAKRDGLLSSMNSAESEVDTFMAKRAAIAASRAGMTNSPQKVCLVHHFNLY